MWHMQYHSLKQKPGALLVCKTKIMYVPFCKNTHIYQLEEELLYFKFAESNGEFSNFACLYWRVVGLNLPNMFFVWSLLNKKQKKKKLY